MNCYWMPCPWSYQHGTTSTSKSKGRKAMKGRMKELRRIRKRRAKIGNALLWATALEIIVCGALTMLTAVCISGLFGTLMFFTSLLCILWLQFFFRANADYLARKFERTFKRKRTDGSDQSSRKFTYVTFANSSYMMREGKVK